MQLTLLDLIICGAIAALAFKGYTLGLVDNIIGFSGLLFVLFIAVQNMDRFTKLLHSTIPTNQITLTFIAFLILAGGGWFFVEKVVAKLQAHINPPDKWKNADKAAGGLMGIIQGIMLVSVFGMMISFLPFEGIKKQQERSIFLRPTIKAAPYIFNVFSVFFPNAKSFVEQLRTSFGDDAIKSDDAQQLLKVLDGEETTPRPQPYPQDNGDGYYGPPKRE
ncbi:CvpA family protein [candidate division KSB1 bacterium]|nr:CvpA family protein [candidate division KSB1 bacterium]